VVIEGIAVTKHPPIRTPGAYGYNTQRSKQSHAQELLLILMTEWQIKSNES
jgi:hypothetical protein